MEEVWKDIPGYEGEYQASNLGRIKSLLTFFKSYTKDGKAIGRILKSFDGDIQGHQVVRLSGSKRASPYVHVLIMLAFVGERPEGMDICHKDGNPRNNRLDNLRYDTRTNNNIDRLKTGQKMNPNSLSHSEVREIRSMIASGRTQRSIAKELNLSTKCICYINTGRTYSWLK